MKKLKLKDIEEVLFVLIIIEFVLEVFDIMIHFLVLKKSLYNEDNTSVMNIYRNSKILVKLKKVKKKKKKRKRK